MRLWRPYTLRVQGGHLIRSFHLRHFVRNNALAPRRILDAGCGSGRDALYFAAMFPSAQIVGIDLDREEIRRAERRRQRHRLDNVRFHAADLLCYCEAEPFDLIYSVEVLEHLPDPEAALKNLASLLEPGGHLLIHTPCLHQRRHWHRFESRTQEDHLHEGFEPAALRRACLDAGLHRVGLRFTFGRFGSLGWELFEMIREYGGFAKRTLFPAIVCLGWLDVWAYNRTGNNILLNAIRPPSHPDPATDAGRPVSPGPFADPPSAGR